MKETVEKIIAELETFGGARSVKQKSRAFVELSVISASADRIAAQYKTSLIDAEVYECFPEYEQKIEYTPPKAQSEIDAVKLAKRLIKDGRTSDLLSIIGISEKALKELEDGEELIAKYKVAKDDSKASLKVSKMTKEELKTSKPEK